LSCAALMTTQTWPMRPSGDPQFDMPALGCPINKYTPTNFQPLQTAVCCCVQQRHIVVMVDELMDSKQWTESTLLCYLQGRSVQMWRHTPSCSIVCLSDHHQQSCCSCHSHDTVLKKEPRYTAKRKVGKAVHCLPADTFFSNLLFPSFIRNLTLQTLSERRDLWQLLLSDLYKNLRNVRVSCPPVPFIAPPPQPPNPPTPLLRLSARNPV
jgi:hypothetical protein